MTRRKRILVAILASMTLALASFAIAISHDSACGPPGELPAEAQRMKAIVARCYGSPDILSFEDVAKPVPAEDELLVKVHAAAVNPLDWHSMRGTPYIIRLGGGFGVPNDTRMGVDFAGTVVAVGKQVTRFKPGDEVFGGKSGSLAEYLVVRESRSVVLKPTNMTFEQAAAVPVAAITALQGLRDHGLLKPGQKVLINGASGGVGTFAVQIAKSLGAEVTGVCSTRNAELVKSIGADRVIDYTREDFTSGDERYDLILDNVGNHSLSEYRRVLQPHGRLVIVGATMDDPWLGPLMQPIKALLSSPFVSQEMGMFIAELNPADLKILGDMLAAGKVKPVIDRRFALSEAAEAIAYVEEGRARGKVVVNVD